MTPHACELFVIGIGGSSCSGKSTLTASLARALAWPTFSLAMDDFFVADTLVPLRTFLCSPAMRASKLPAEQQRHYQETIVEQHPDGSELVQWPDWDCLDAIDWPSYNGRINELAAVRHRAIDPGSMELFLSRLPFRRRNSAAVTTKIMLIIEGFLIFHPRASRSIFDARLWLHSDYDTCRARRQGLGTIATKEGLWHDPPGYFEAAVWPRYIELCSLLQEDPDFASLYKLDTHVLSIDQTTCKVLQCLCLKDSET